MDTPNVLLGLGLLLACTTSGPFEASVRCDVPGLGPVRIEDPRPCKCISSRMTAAMQLVRDRVGREGDDFSDVEVWIYANNVEVREDTKRRGIYTKEGSSGGRIEVTRDMDSIVHEFLHHVELRHRGVSEEDSLGHMRWRLRREGDSTSYRLVDEEWRRLFDPLRGRPTCP